MEQMLSNNWFVTVMGGALASLVAALVVAIISNFRPSVLSLYWKALTRICEDFVVSPGDKRILQRALKTPDVEEAIKTRASNPGEEAELLCKAVSFLAPPSSRLADPLYTASLVGQLLDNEFKLEGSEKYQIFHDRNRDRHLYFDPPQAPLDLTITATSQQITLTWNVTSHSFIGTTIWRYHIARSTNPNGPFTEEVGIVQVGDGNPLSFTDKGLMNGTTYYYVVTAESKVLKRGIPSEPISAVPMSAMPSTVAQK